ncbi:hypothetical protein MBLNU13_g05247t1 [Cladosporium sp. NU13]
MASFTRYTLLDLAGPSLAHQVVTDITEDLFCGAAVEPIFVAVIQEGGQRADDFDHDLFNFIANLPAQCKGDVIAYSQMWEVLEDRSISKGIADAISAYVRSLAAYRNATAADAEIGYLMSFKEDAIQGGAPAAPAIATQSAPRFSLDSTTATALVDRKTYEALNMESYKKILSHRSYFDFVSEKLFWVLQAYAHRIMHAIELEPSLWVHRVLGAWARDMSGIPPHLIRFTPYKPGTNTAIWLLFKPKKDQLRPGFVRMHWSCSNRERHLDIPERIVQATKAAIATAPKVPYLSSEWAGALPLFIHPYYEKRWRKGAPVPKDVLQSWKLEAVMDRFQCDPYGD